MDQIFYTNIQTLKNNNIQRVEILQDGNDLISLPETTNNMKGKIRKHTPDQNMLFLTLFLLLPINETGFTN